MIVSASAFGVNISVNYTACSLVHVPLSLSSPVSDTIFTEVTMAVTALKFAVKM
ncbi:MAG: hypothetical protein ACYC1M_05185 [Armatimonadota bacterium]